MVEWLNWVLAIEILNLILLIYRYGWVTQLGSCHNNSLLLKKNPKNKQTKKTNKNKQKISKTPLPGCKSWRKKFEHWILTNLWITCISLDLAFIFYLFHWTMLKQNIVQIFVYHSIINWTPLEGIECQIIILKWFGYCKSLYWQKLLFSAISPFFDTAILT